MTAFQPVFQRPGYQPTAQVKWQLVLLFPWFIPLITYLLLGERYVRDWETFLGATLLNAGIGVSCQLLLDFLTQRIAGLFPSIRQTRQRLVLLLLAFLTITPLFIVGPLWAYGHWHWFGYQPTPGVLSRILLVNVVVNLISVGTFESVYSLNKWRESMLEKEQLKKANLQSQYESLKNQVNPHFLFNTLNSLSSLIADEPQRAEAFIDQMARVYRYLLQTNRRTDTSANGELTTLATELNFIDSYFHLLKTRYGAGIDLVVDVPDDQQNRLLPPLTLQMLVENAVKHNIIQAQKPLLITICSLPDGRLSIRNNLQRKNTRSDRRPVLSNQVGLSNIQAKYRLLASRQASPGQVVISEDESHFTVIIPLLTPTTV